MPVDAPAERNFRIVGVKDWNVTEANRAVDYVNRGGQPGFASDVIARGKEMRGVEASGGRHVFKSGKDLRYFFQSRANSDTHPRRVFDEDTQAAKRNALGALPHGFDDGGNGSLTRVFASRAWMNHQKIGTKSYGAYKLIMECLDRAHPQHRLCGSKIDQIVRVNDERAEAEFR